MTKVEFTVALPASFGQRRLWFLSTTDQDAHLAYHMIGGVHVRGRLDPDVLERALRVVIDRHEVLRTTFQLRDGEPCQLVHPVLDFTLTRVGDGVRADAVLEAQTRLPFDLATGPLIRATVVTETPESHTVVLALHHAICDGWSLAVLLREIVTAYDALAAGRPVELAPPPIQYADYAVWQQNRLDSGELADQLTYWRHRLADLPELPLPRTTGPSFAGGYARRNLGAALAADLATLARAEGATTHAALIAAITALLHGFTGRTDVAVGTAVAGRNHVDLEGLIGFFVNTLVIRTDHAGDPSFRELLRRIGADCLDAHANQDVPFEKLVELLRPRRATGNPFFQVMVTLQNQPPAVLAARGLSFEPLPAPHPFATFPLDFVFREDTVDGLRCELGYRASMFDAEVVQRLLAALAGLLSAAVAEPDRPVSTLLSTLMPSDAFADVVLRTPGEPDPDTPHVAPRTELETAIADQWRALLRPLEPIGVHDDFFDLGGHSLLAVRAMAELGDALGVELPVNLVLEHRTIARLAEHLGHAEYQAAAPIPRLARDPR